MKGGKKFWAGGETKVHIFCTMGRKAILPEKKGDVWEVFVVSFWKWEEEDYDQGEKSSWDKAPECAIARKGYKDEKTIVTNNIRETRVLRAHSIILFTDILAWRGAVGIFGRWQVVGIKKCTWSLNVEEPLLRRMWTGKADNLTFTAGGAMYMVWVCWFWNTGCLWLEGIIKGWHLK